MTEMHPVKRALVDLLKDELAEYFDYLDACDDECVGGDGYVNPTKLADKVLVMFGLGAYAEQVESK